MANILTSLKNWSTTEASNQPDSTDATTLVGDLRAIQAGVRYLRSQDTIASATTCDLGTKDAESLTISGTTTITGLGTVSAGIIKRVTFSGALLLTYNATSLILPSNANITTVAGDTAEFESLGSGNWRCNWYTRDAGKSVAAIANTDLPAGSVLQVVTATHATEVVISTVDTETDTGLTATITPSSTSSKILVLVSQEYYLAAPGVRTNGSIYLLRGASEIIRAKLGIGSNTDDSKNCSGVCSFVLLDSPSTASAVTYKTRASQEIASGSITLQRDSLLKSSIVLMEIAG
jgi:hypothetical protein